MSKEGKPEQLTKISSRNPKAGCDTEEQSTRPACAAWVQPSTGRGEMSLQYWVGIVDPRVTSACTTLRLCVYANMCVTVPSSAAGGGKPHSTKYTWTQA